MQTIIASNRKRCPELTIILLWVIILTGQIAGCAIYGKIFLDHFTSRGFAVPSDLYCFWANGALAVGHSALDAKTVSNLCAFMYPPPFFLIAAPLSWLSPVPAYAVWEIATNILLLFAGRAIGFSWWAVFLGLAAPTNLLCAAVGQIGEIISAFLLLALGLAECSPVAAGVMAGCLIIKPQYGVLLPVCYLASHNYKAFAAAAVTGTALCIASYVIFGDGIWQHFVAVELGTEHLRLDLPWPQPFQNIMTTPFIMFRSLGAGISLANGLQALVTIAAACGAARSWSRPATGAATKARLTLTICLIALATPFGYLYDLPCLGVAILGFTVAAHWHVLLPLAVFMVFTGFYILISVKSFVMGPVLMAALVALLWRHGAARSHSPAPA